MKQQQQSQQQHVAQQGTPSDWDSAIDKESGVRYYINKASGESQWEKPDNFIEPKSLFVDASPPKTLASQLANAKPSGKVSTSEVDVVVFSTAAGANEAKKLLHRQTIKETGQSQASSAGKYAGGALGFIVRQKKAAEMLQKYIRGRKARKELKKKLRARDLWVKENAKKTGAYDDLFDRLRERGAKIRTLDVWEQWLDSSGRIFYYNPIDARGQWAPPLAFQQALDKEEGGRVKAIKEDAAMRRLEKTWDDRTGGQDTIKRLELTVTDRMQSAFKGNDWVRGIDSLKASGAYTCDSREVENYRYRYGTLKNAEQALDVRFERDEEERKKVKAMVPTVVQIEGKQLLPEESDDDVLDQEPRSKKHPKKKERFIETTSRGNLDVNDPDMLRRSFILKRGYGKCENWIQLADPVQGLKFYKDTIKYTFQWERPQHWDEEPIAPSATKKKSKLKIKTEAAESSGRSTPQKIIIGIMNPVGSRPRITMPKTRLRIDGSEKARSALASPLSLSPTKTIRVNAETSLARVMEHVGNASIGFSNPASQEEDFWLKESVQDMIYGDMTTKGRNKPKHILIPPQSGGTTSQKEDTAESNPFAAVTRDLLSRAEAEAAQKGVHVGSNHDSVHHAASTTAVVKFFASLSSVSTPRNKLKVRRIKQRKVEGSRGAFAKEAFGEITNKILNTTLDEAATYTQVFPYAHPKVHALDKELLVICRSAESEIMSDFISKRDAKALLSCNRASKSARSQFFSPASTPHQLSLSNDRFQSYALPGPTSMVRSDTTLGHSSHCTQRLMQLRGGGKKVVEVTLDEREERDSDWCIFTTRKGLSGFESIPPLVFRPSEADLEHRRHGLLGKQVAPPPPPRDPPPVQHPTEFFFINKKTFLCQAGIPFELAMSSSSSGKGWKRTGRMVRTGYGLDLKNYEQYCNAGNSFVLYKLVSKSAGSEPKNDDYDDDEEEEDGSQLTQIFSPSARFVSDPSLEESMRAAASGVSSRGSAKSIAAVAAEFSVYRQFEQAASRLRSVASVLGVEFEEESDDVDSVAEQMNALLLDAAALAIQSSWRGSRVRSPSSSPAKSPSATARPRDISVSSSTGDQGGTFSVLPIEPSVKEAKQSTQSTPANISRILNAAFEHLSFNENGEKYVAQLSLIQMLNQLRQRGRSTGENAALDDLGAMLPLQNTEAMNTLFRFCDDRSRFDKTSFRSLFDCVCDCVFGDDADERSATGRSVKNKYESAQPQPSSSPRHISYAVSARVSIARGWCLAAAKDLDAASKAASCALEHVLESSRAAPKGSMDIEALIGVGELIGTGLGDFAAQATLLNVCLNVVPDHPAVLRSCGKMIDACVDEGVHFAHHKQVQKFLNDTVVFADAAAVEAGGKSFYAYERADALCNLARFELTSNDSNYSGDETAAPIDSKGAVSTTPAAIPLVSVERRLRQSYSILASLLEAGGGGEKLRPKVYSLASKISFNLAKVLHTYKGFVTGITTEDGAIACEEALKLYESARVFGEASLPGRGKLLPGCFDKAITTNITSYHNRLTIGVHEACLLANIGESECADEKFLSVLFRHQHEVYAKSSSAWLIYGSFLENIRCDVDKAERVYLLAADVSKPRVLVEYGFPEEVSRSKEHVCVDALLAAAQLSELQVGDTLSGAKYLQSSIEVNKSYDQSAAALVSAAQFASEVDGDVVSAAQLLSRSLAVAPGYGPALRWQGLLLCRAGQFDDALKALLESCSWRGDESLGRVYTPGLRCAALMSMAHASAADVKEARAGLGTLGNPVIAKRASNAAIRSRELLARATLAEPRCRLTHLANALLQLAYFGNPKKAETHLLSACLPTYTKIHIRSKIPQESALCRSTIGIRPSDTLRDVIPAEALRTLARFQDANGSKAQAVNTWKRCLHFSPGDRLAMAGLATTLWGIERGNVLDKNVELSTAGEQSYREWRAELLAEAKRMFVVCTSPASAATPDSCDLLIPPECHSLFGAFLQDGMGDNPSALEQLALAAKGWKVLSEAREAAAAAASPSAGLFLCGSADVPATVLYRLGACAEANKDLAAAERFYTWAMDVSPGDVYAVENVKHVVSWAERDCRASLDKYNLCKGKLRRVLGDNSSGGAATMTVDNKDAAVKAEEEIAFAARSYMLHRTLSTYAQLKRQSIENATPEKSLISGDWVSLVERGWEGRMLCKFAGRDSWQTM